MPIYRRAGSAHWWVRIGRKTRRSTGTSDRAAAEEFEHRLRERLWRLNKLGDRGAVTWKEVTTRWLTESSIGEREREIVGWFAPHLDEEAISTIDRDAIEELRKIAADEGKSPASIDRMMCVLRAILKKSAEEWRYIEYAPKVPMYRPPPPEPRWLTQEEFSRLCRELPKHLELAARFAVATLLRMRSMLALTWDRIDLAQRRLWIPGEQMKAGRSHGLPLSKEAVRILRELKTLNPEGVHVFQWEGKPIDDCNTNAFQKAVKRAKVEPLRWHDLRHTGASWLVQNGATLQELMEYGGWKSYSMVLRYSHLAPDHLAVAAERVGKLVSMSRRQKRTNL